MGRPYAYVQIALVLATDGEHPAPASGAESTLGSTRAAFRELRVRAPGDLIVVGAAVLHAFRSQGVRRIDHWELDRFGWLPIPQVREAGDRLDECVSDILEALAEVPQRAVDSAESLSLRLSRSGDRVDITLRKGLRRPGYALGLDLHGRWPREAVRSCERALRDRLPVARSEIVSYRYAY